MDGSEKPTLSKGKSQRRQKREVAAAALGISVDELVRHRRDEAERQLSDAAARRGLTVAEHLARKAAKKVPAKPAPATGTSGHGAVRKLPRSLLATNPPSAATHRERMKKVREILGRGDKPGSK